MTRPTPGSWTGTGTMSPVESDTSLSYTVSVAPKGRSRVPLSRDLAALLSKLERLDEGGAS